GVTHEATDEVAELHPSLLASISDFGRSHGGSSPAGRISTAAYPSHFQQCFESSLADRAHSGLPASLRIAPDYRSPSVCSPPHTPRVFGRGHCGARRHHHQRRLRLSGLLSHQLRRIRTHQRLAEYSL